MTLLVLAGRKLQGGDKPIALVPRSFYTMAIATVLILVLRCLWLDRGRLIHRALRLAATSRRQPMLALYLGFWLVVVLFYAPTIVLPGIGGGLETLWSGGSIGYANLIGDNSAAVVFLFGMLLLAIDIAAAIVCIACVPIGTSIRAAAAE